MADETAMDRVRQRNEAAKLLWWWRIPYLAILAVTLILLWIFIGGLPGFLVAFGVGAAGIYVAAINPWAVRDRA